MTTALNEQNAQDTATAGRVVRVIGAVVDVEFPRGGRSSPKAGLDFVRTVREAYQDIPIVLHSSRPEFEEQARRVGAGFLRKGSHHVLGELRRILLEDFGFGDFVFGSAFDVVSDTTKIRMAGFGETLDPADALVAAIDRQIEARILPH